MDYIVNPMWFYWLGLCDGLKTFCYIIASVLGLTVLSVQVWYIVTKINDGGDEKPSGWNNISERKAAKPFLVAGWIITIIFSIAAIFIPSKETLIAMMIGRVATVQNIQAGIEAVKSAADYVVEAIASLK